MAGFLYFIIGGIFGTGIMAVIQAKRNTENEEKLTSAIKLKDYYKDKCKEIQEELKRYKK